MTMQAFLKKLREAPSRGSFDPLVKWHSDWTAFTNTLNHWLKPLVEGDWCHVFPSSEDVPYLVALHIKGQGRVLVQGFIPDTLHLNGHVRLSHGPSRAIVFADAKGDWWVGHVDGMVRQTNPLTEDAFVEILTILLNF